MRRNQATTTDIVIYVEEEDYEAEVEMTVSFDPGTPPWKGSMYSCPSSDDYYGVAAYLECVDEVVEITVWHDNAPVNEQGVHVETLTGWEFDHAARDLVGRVEDGDLREEAERAFDEALERMAEDAMDCRW